MFCTNPKSPSPIHDVIADIIEVCGGSRQLIRILNRLGCCSSADTHDRFVTQHAMAQRQRTIWDNIPTNTFTIASVDNFDMLQSYSAVYCGDQQRSYHGTTLQLVQPDPINLVLPFSTVDFRVPQLSPAKSPPQIRQNLRQRQRQISPDSSPHKLGKNGPKRQRTVAVRNLTAPKHNTSNTNNNTVPVLTLNNFVENKHQTKERTTLHDNLFSYILQKYVFHHYTNSDVVPTNATFSEIRMFLDDHSDYSQLQHSSTVYYMELVNENPDCTETMSLVAEDLLVKFDEVQDGWVVLVGDGKSYKHLMNIKKQYSTALRKLLIFPGDWHILKNYQPILMKIYYSAGLREMAKNSGYHGTTLKSVEQCSNLKRTHYFLLQTWEALYREMLHAYIVYTGTTITTDANSILLASIQTKKSPNSVLQRISKLVEDSQTDEDFRKFIKQMSDNDKTWKFWAQFVFTDCFCYFGLYLAIRSSNWQLRVASLMQMAPMFAAFDREYYSRIIPHHLAEVHCYPSSVLDCLKRGGFTVNLTGQKWRAVALDEAHEMCINKDLKTAVVRPTKSYLQKTSLFFNYRIKLYKNIIQQLFPERLIHQMKPTDILDDSPQAYRYEQNVKQLCTIAIENNLFCIQPNNRELMNVFTGQLATHEQTCDMLSFRQIGEQAFQNYVKYHILQHPSSAKSPLRQHKLMTMAMTKTRKPRSTPREREAKQVITCLRRRLAWLSHHNEQPCDTFEEQYSELPRALSDEDGNPHKGSKSTWTDKLASRYLTADPPVFTSLSPFTPQVVIIDAMFIINTRPLRRTKTFSEYAHFLFNQFIAQHFKEGTLEVHVIFDKANKLPFNPKHFEHIKRYSKHNPDHQHCSFSPETPVPNSWQEYLQCQQCKRSIVEAVGLALLQKGRYFLTGQQRLVLAGCFSGLGDNNAWLLCADEVSIEHPDQYYSTAEEADIRIWRHAMQCQASNILIYSPDTDVYNIGLGLLNQHPTATYAIQLNVPHSDEKKYININNLKVALLKDLDLSNLPQDQLCAIMQTLFICTGCDYTSYFKFIGKATILNNFFQHASFISGHNMPGCLSYTLPSNKQHGFLSFVRLVGTCYFKKHLSAFIALKGHNTPNHLYNSLDPSLQLEERHKQWLHQIREIVIDRIINEEDRVPTFTSLWRHWLRSCWVSQFWQHSNHPDIFNQLPNPEESGWLLQCDKYIIDWESSEVQQNIRQRIDFLTKGCNCKKGCKTLKCGCRKRSHNCGPGCLCQGCTNVSIQQLESLPGNSSSSSSSSSSDNTDEEETPESHHEDEQLEEEVITEDDFYFTTYDIL